ncbi:MAG TPA: preprotein translocase subunit SecG [Casimicrobiaceae bacterium]|nr:preprotein translocase subunit SecG [Casimicrobiaceae bacterium]
MNLWESLLLAAHVLVAIGICGFVLLQHGKGADMGAAFGSGASGSLFGAAGSANFLSRTTAILVALFFLTSLGLTWYASTRGGTQPAAEQGVMERLPSKASDIPAAPGAAPAAPAAPAPAPAGEAAKPAPAAPLPEGSKAGEVPK